MFATVGDYIASHPAPALPTCATMGTVKLVASPVQIWVWFKTFGSHTHKTGCCVCSSAHHMGKSIKKNIDFECQSQPQFGWQGCFTMVLTV